MDNTQKLTTDCRMKAGVTSNLVVYTQIKAVTLWSRHEVVVT